MPHRYLCTVLEEMRECYKHMRFDLMKGLIEEAQIMGNRMEDALYDKKDLKRAYDEKKKVRKEIEKLKKKKEKLEKKCEDLAKSHSGE